MMWFNIKYLPPGGEEKSITLLAHDSDEAINKFFHFTSKENKIIYYKTEKVTFK